MATNKHKTVDEYIKSFPPVVGGKLRMIRSIIGEIIPSGEEVISYKIPVVKLNGKPVIYFAAWEKHVSIYPFTAEMVKKMKETSKYKASGRGTIRFSVDDELPVEFIRKIVKFLVKKSENRL